MEISAPSPIPILFLSRQVQFLVGILPDAFAPFCLDEGGQSGREDGYGPRLEWLVEHGRGIRGIIAAGLEILDDAMLALLPDLEIISLITAGYTDIAVATAERRGIVVTNSGDINAGDVAEFAVAMMLAHRREIVANQEYMLADRWLDARRLPARSIATERVGIVGLGAIGIETAKRLEPFGCEIGWWGPNPKPGIGWPRHETLLALAGWASTLIVAARGDESNRGTISRDVLEALGPQGLIVNVARGLVIDEPAMIDCLRSGKLGGAALDVFDREPFAGSAYADVPGLLMAPHVGGATQQAFAKVAAEARANIDRWFAGNPVSYRVV